MGNKREDENSCKPKIGIIEFEIFQKRWKETTEKLKRISASKQIDLSEIPIVGR